MTVYLFPVATGGVSGPVRAAGIGPRLIYTVSESCGTVWALLSSENDSNSFLQLPSYMGMVLSNCKGTEGFHSVSV